ncbi:hypothetical protein [Actinoplanes missouriensis]|uniref:hypothetical protein n=1 Tax=Actinoplanes missouriensis TaxID=1866 RepID=UPI0005A08C52|nr:hypothetical protein [Actinoplanes missouriensis]
MLVTRIAPLAVAAAFGLAFASPCDGEKTIGDAAAISATGPDPSGETRWRPWVELISVAPRRAEK